VRMIIRAGSALQGFPASAECQTPGSRLQPLGLAISFDPHMSLFWLASSFPTDLSHQPSQLSAVVPSPPHSFPCHIRRLVNR